jgi:hypothetical protein
LIHPCRARNSGDKADPHCGRCSQPSKGEKVATRARKAVRSRGRQRRNRGDSDEDGEEADDEELEEAAAALLLLAPEEEAACAGRATAVSAFGLFCSAISAAVCACGPAAAADAAVVVCSSFQLI